VPLRIPSEVMNERGHEMIRKILVGTDTSASADLAVNTAADLARTNGAELTVLYVRPPEAAREVFDPKRSADPDAYLGKMVARFPDLRIRTRAEGGEPADRICAVAAEEGADVIVVGNRGIDGRRRGFLQSVPATVARHSPCSVLIVDTRVAH
jgi:nucleotide-binding universal stress UspA family protein